MTIACAPMCVVAQQNVQVVVNELPDAPIPVVSFSSSVSATMTLPGKQAQQIKKHRWFTAYNESVAALVIGEAVDTWGTHRNMTHPKFVCGWNSTPGFAAAYSSTDNTYNINEVDTLCGTFPQAQDLHANYAYDVTQLGMFTETGWAAKWGIAGNRDFARVEVANITSDILHVLVVKYLNKKSGWMGKIGNATLLFHAEEHLRLGKGNFSNVASNSDPNAVFNNHPNDLPAWADTFPRWWGKK